MKKIKLFHAIPEKEVIGYAYSGLLVVALVLITRAQHILSGLYHISETIFIYLNILSIYFFQAWSWAFKFSQMANSSST